MKSKYLKNYPFIIGLLVLLFNDHLFKGLFGNWFTGKLSDFSGIFIFPFFLKFIFSISDKKAIFITLFGFFIWKLPLFQQVIDSVNSISFLKFSRVQDYTDYVAFIVLPLSFYCIKNIDNFNLKLNKYSTPLIGIFSFCTFVATTVDDDNFNALESCPKSVEEIVGNGKIFIPNIFSPNGDNKDDFFQIVANENIKQIDSFKVQNKNNIVIFDKKNITEITIESGFPGEVTEFAIEKYRYEITITANNDISKTFTGEFFSAKCEKNYTILNSIALDNCTLNSKYNIQNGLTNQNLAIEDLCGD